jgi:type II secretion system protein J
MRNPRRAAFDRGFTLIELLVTLAIMALVMTALLGALHGTVRAHDEAQVEISSVRDGPRILDLVEHDLRALHVYNMKDGNVLSGKEEHPGGLRGDRIDFVCSNDSSRRIVDTSHREQTEDVAADLNEVGYRLRSSALSSDFVELWRREDLFVDEEPFEGGTYEKIHDRIRRFEITYLDHLGDKPEEKTEWNMAEEKKLPGAIRIDLELQASPELVGGFIDVNNDALRTYTYTRVIAFPDDETVALRVRPYLPTKITGRNDNGGGKGGKKDDETKLGIGGGQPGGGGDVSTGDGGQTMKDFFEKNGGKGGDSNKIDLNIINNSGNTKIDVNIGDDGNLSESDQKKIEDFLNDYRNRYSGRGGLGGGGGGSSPFGGGGGGGARPPGGP